MLISFSTYQEPWTGIYYCKGEKHQDQFYCGQGRCAFDRKGKIKICEVEKWYEFGQSLYFGKRFFNCPMDFRFVTLI